VEETLRILEFVTSNSSSGRIETSKSSKVERGLKSPHRIKPRRKDAMYLARSHQGIEKMVEIIRGRINKVLWVIGSSGSMKRLRLSVLQYSQDQED